MDHQAFLQRLLDALGTWRKLDNVACESFEVSPPDPEGVKEFAAKHPGILSRELSSFYADACGAANIDLTISVPGGKSVSLKTPVAGGSEEVEVVWAGFQLASLSQASTWRSDILEIVEGLLGTHASKSEVQTARNILGKAIPLAVMKDSSFLLWINTQWKITPGLYWLDYGYVGEPQNAFKYCASFDDWLLFLEQSLYLSADFSFMEWFRGESGLRPNPALRDELAKLLKLPIP